MNLTKLRGELKIKLKVRDNWREFDPETKVICPCCGNVEKKEAGFIPAQTIQICKNEDRGVGHLYYGPHFFGNWLW